MSHASVVLAFQSDIPDMRKGFEKGRPASGFSRREIGGAIGSSIGSIESFERGTSIPKGEALLNIAMLVDEWSRGIEGKITKRMINARLEKALEGIKTGPFNLLPVLPSDLN